MLTAALQALPAAGGCTGNGTMGFRVLSIRAARVRVLGSGCIVNVAFVNIAAPLQVLGGWYPWITGFRHEGFLLQG